MSSRNTILAAIRDAIAGSATIKAWTQANYSADHKVFVGIDRRNPPGESDCPFVVILPEHKKAGLSANVIQHEFYLCCAICDENTRTGLASNITEYSGVQNIETFRGLVLDAIDGASFSGRITEIETGDEPFDAFPILLQDMLITIKEETEFGDSFVQ